MATVLPAPAGTIYFLKPGAEAWTSPGRPDIPLVPGVDPIGAPFLTDSGFKVNDGKVLRV